MKVEVLEEKENPLLRRREIILRVQTSPTPKREEARKAISQALGVDTSLIVVHKIHQEAGKEQSTIYARIYKDKKTLTDIDAQYKITRDERKAKKSEEKTEPPESALGEEKPASKEGEVEEVPSQEPLEAQEKGAKKEETGEQGASSASAEQKAPTDQ